MRTGETDLEKARSIVAEGERRIARLKQLIIEAEASHLDPRLLRETLLETEDHVDEWREILSAIESDQSKDRT